MKGRRFDLSTQEARQSAIDYLTKVMGDHDQAKCVVFMALHYSGRAIKITPVEDGICEIEYFGTRETDLEQINFDAMPW